MANDNKKINKLVTEQDDDPTAELELLSVAACAESEDMQQAEAESDANTFDFDKLNSEIDDADETIASLKSELKSRAKNISKLEFDIEHLRSRSSGLKKEVTKRPMLKPPGGRRKVWVGWPLTITSTVDGVVTSPLNDGVAQLK